MKESKLPAAAIRKCKICLTFTNLITFTTKASGENNLFSDFSANLSGICRRFFCFYFKFFHNDIRREKNGVSCKYLPFVNDTEFV